MGRALQRSMDCKVTTQFWSHTTPCHVTRDVIGDVTTARRRETGGCGYCKSGCGGVRARGLRTYVRACVFTRTVSSNYRRACTITSSSRPSSSVSCLSAEAARVVGARPTSALHRDEFRQDDSTPQRCYIYKRLGPNSITLSGSETWSQTRFPAGMSPLPGGR